MRRYFVLLITIIICSSIIFISCGPRSNDRPPDPDTPEPPPHNGYFKGDYGSMTFNGDGETVQINFLPDYLSVLDNPPNHTEYNYSFTWYNFGICRYDVATEFSVLHKESETYLTFSLDLEDGGTTEERIGFSYPSPDKKAAVFYREEDF